MITHKWQKVYCAGVNTLEEYSLCVATALHSRVMEILLAHECKLAFGLYCTMRDGTEIGKGKHFWLPKSVRGTDFGRGTEIFITGSMQVNSLINLQLR